MSEEEDAQVLQRHVSDLMGILFNAEPLILQAQLTWSADFHYPLQHR